jgi:hypothetical protein
MIGVAMVGAWSIQPLSIFGLDWPSVLFGYSGGSFENEVHRCVRQES